VFFHFLPAFCSHVQGTCPCIVSFPCPRIGMLGGGLPAPIWDLLREHGGKHFTHPFNLTSLPSDQATERYAETSVTVSADWKIDGRDIICQDILHRVNDEELRTLTKNLPTAILIPSKSSDSWHSSLLAQQVISERDRCTS